MITIEVSVDEDVFKEAEQVLHSIGMDVPTAVSVFLRRVALEKGLPMAMNAPKDSPEQDDNATGYGVMLPEKLPSPARTSTKITKKMVDEVWRAFLKYHKGLAEIGSLVDEIVENSGMNRGSASIYMYVLSSFAKGEPNTRILKVSDLEYLLQKVKTDLGEKQLQSALQSLRKSLPYWREKIQGFYPDKVEALCEKYEMGQN